MEPRGDHTVCALSRQRIDFVELMFFELLFKQTYKVFNKFNFATS